jgi:hypothetical protein
MSLPVNQQRILDQIEGRLRAHDSRLAAMFGSFTRLTRHEEMPQVEQLKPGRWRGAPRTRGRAGGPQWTLFVPFAVFAVLSAFIIGLLVTSAHGTCAPRATRSGSAGPAGSAGSAARASSLTTACTARPVTFWPNVAGPG